MLLVRFTDEETEVPGGWQEVEWLNDWGGSPVSESWGGEGGAWGASLGSLPLKPGHLGTFLLLWLLSSIEKWCQEVGVLKVS